MLETISVYFNQFTLHGINWYFNGAMNAQTAQNVRTAICEFRIGVGVSQ